jgi:5-methylcytosine-specific restriction endonuclease McrA
MDASEFYSWLVFTLFIAGAIFLAVFVVLQWAKDGPKGHRVASVLLLYTLLYVLLLLLSLPFDPFDAGLLARIAVVLGSGVGLGVVVGSIFSVVRGIIRWIRRLRAEERQQSQLAEAKDQSRVQVSNEEGERSSRRLRRQVRDVVLALGAQFYPFWQRERLRAEERRRAKEQRRAEKRQLAEEQRQATEQKRRQEQEEEIRTFLELMRGEEKGLKKRSLSIPQPVKMAVVTRDGGKCRRCRSTQDLQYDHIVPYSSGGSSTDVNNIQLLCGKCSRLKSNRNIG